MKEEPPVNVWEICVRARSSECETVVVCLNHILSNKKKALYNSSIFCLFPEDENSTRQTGRETYDFYSPGSIGEWASAKRKPCCMVIFSFWREFLQGTFQKTSLLTVICCYKTRNKKTEKELAIPLQIILKRRK